MTQILIDKINKSREQTVVAGGLSFIVRRPTDLDVLEMRGKTISKPERVLLKEFVVDWMGVTELDLIPGGTPKPVAFDAEVFLVWVADRPEIYAVLLEHIINAYKLHEQQREAELKKPDAG